MPQADNSHSGLNCTHPSLQHDCSPHADKVGYRRPTAKQRAIAAGRAKRSSQDFSDASFPAPLLLPGDDLALDPRWPAQSLRSWTREKERNEVTSDRNVIYLASAPRYDSNVAFLKSWAEPQSPLVSAKQRGQESICTSGIQDIADYLAAFYHGIAVKMLPPKSLRFTSWTAADTKALNANPKAKSHHIGLATSKELMGIRTRPCPDKVFATQLNLNDLLDTAMAVLPDDAYTLLMLVDQDLYEDEDDDYCCGRAYGGSRIAVVSAARYNPLLDALQSVNREHAWPASHCAAYVEACYGEPAQRQKKAPNSESNEPQWTVSALQAAISAITSSPSQSPCSDSPYDLWLACICRTAGHELGHCFGIDHCVYYACMMQGTASLAEDLRQPPYLCPVDLAKVLRATGVTAKNRYEALLRFCEGKKEVSMFRAFGAWLKWRLGELGTATIVQAGNKGALALDRGSRNSPIELSP
ncbi:hypothetical protein MMC21_007267 [Puttea exsequens]|nr:hypothetical protein [Puttea exsequens]